MLLEPPERCATTEAWKAWEVELLALDQAGEMVQFELRRAQKLLAWRISEEDKALWSDDGHPGPAA